MIARTPETSSDRGCRNDIGSAKVQGINLLLVSNSPEWDQAVRSATAEMGSVTVRNCTAREAVIHIAGVSSHYSHLLIDRADADGLAEELLALATETGPPDTAALVLGSTGGLHPLVRSVAKPTPLGVKRGLSVQRTRHARPPLNAVDLRAALDAAMIETRYQPIVRVSDGKPAGVEVLARLNHPLLGRLLPGSFLPQLEDAGLSAELTAQISARAFAELTGPVMAARPMRVSVNFPLDVLVHPDALERLENNRAAIGLDASRIVIELTESLPVRDFTEVRRSLEHLRALGYGVAIDDAGPAVPDLDILMELPFTSVKLDKDLVVLVNRCHKAQSLLDSIISRGKQHAMTIVAEGVETPEIWQQMKSLGVDEVQGYLAARPLPLAALPIWLDAWNLGALSGL